MKSAVVEFNEGANGVIRVFEKLGIDIGKETVGSTVKKNKTRIKKMNLKTLDSTKKRRKQLRKVKKGLLDKERERERKGGVLCTRGIFMIILQNIFIFTFLVALQF